MATNGSDLEGAAPTSSGQNLSPSNLVSAKSEKEMNGGSTSTANAVECTEGVTETCVADEKMNSPTMATDTAADNNDNRNIFRSGTPPPPQSHPHSPSRRNIQQESIAESAKIGLTTPSPNSPDEADLEASATGGTPGLIRINSSPGLIDTSPKCSPPNNQRQPALPTDATAVPQLSQSLHGGAIPHMRPRASMPSHGYELTPVIRNTTSDDDDHLFTSGDRIPEGLGFVVVSPEDDQEDDGHKISVAPVQQLHRRVIPRRPAPQAAAEGSGYDDSLALPHSHDLSGHSTEAGGTANVPYLPKSNHVRKRILVPSSLPQPNAAHKDSKQQDAKAGKASSHGHDLSPIQLKSDRKYYSFNGRSQYRRALAEASIQRAAQENAASSEKGIIAGSDSILPHCNGIPLATIERNGYGDIGGVGLPPMDSNIPMRKQYQPSRENSLTEIGVGATLKKEELASIFNTNRGGASSSSASVKTSRQQFFLSQQHHLPQSSPANEVGDITNAHSLSNPIPLDERDLSIPSIRLANHLTNVSTNSYGTNSYTCSEEEDLDEAAYEDGVLIGVEGTGTFGQSYDDDATLSSQDSPVVLAADEPTEEIADEATDNVHPLFRQQPLVNPVDLADVAGAAVLIEDGLEKISIHGGRDDMSDSAAAVALSACIIPDSNRSRRGHVRHHSEGSPLKSRHNRVGSADLRSKSKKTKKEEKERKAYEWLRTVEIGRENEFLAEAASSKFLTGGVRPAVTTGASSSVSITASGTAKQSSTSPRSTVQPLAPLKLNRVLTSPPTLANGKNTLVSGAAANPRISNLASNDTFDEDEEDDLEIEPVASSSLDPSQP